MAKLSDYLENKIINHMLRNQAYTPPTTVYVALFTTATADDGSGTEVSGGSYARQVAGLSAASSGASSNVSDITFPTATADWGTVTHMALMGALTAGEMLMHSILGTSKTIDNGDIFKFNAGSLDVTMA